MLLLHHHGNSLDPAPSQRRNNSNTLFILATLLFFGFCELNGSLGTTKGLLRDISDFYRQETAATATAATDDPYTAWTNLSDYRLEFIHIPKNAGTFVESVGLQHNISWGACHFNFPWKHNKANVLKDCPKMKKQVPRSKECYWHYSLTQIRELWHDDEDNFEENRNNTNETTQHPPRAGKVFASNPYDSVSIHTPEHLIQAPIHYFAVVRNPFTRVLSMAQIEARGRPLTKAWFNKIVNRTYGNDSPYFKKNSFPVCQSQYIYDINHNDQQLVQHVVRFENLTSELNELFQLYHVPIRPLTRQSKKVNAARRKFQNRTSISDLTQYAIDLIVARCPLDFQLGPYPHEPLLS